MVVSLHPLGKGYSKGCHEGSTIWGPWGLGVPRVPDAAFS